MAPRLRAARWTAVLGATLAAVASCREPTQITLVITTDAQCPAEAPEGPTLLDTFIASGVTLRNSELVAANVTEQCEPKSGDNLVGTLVLIPGQKDESSVSVVIIGGVDAHTADTAGAPLRQSADECRALLEADQSIEGKACIVARRRLGFIEHKSLRLPVKLDKRCIGVQCGEDQTCFAGSCVSSEVVCDPDSGVCEEPTGQGGAGAGGAGGMGGMGGMGGGCVASDCLAACQMNAQGCDVAACACSGCDPAGCQTQCDAFGDVGSCDDGTCTCFEPCDTSTCMATCTPPTVGQCDPNTQQCECLCDQTSCDAACGGVGQGDCSSGGCVCNQGCGVPADCTMVTCSDPFVVACIGGSCACACDQALCDAPPGCQGGGTCVGGAPGTCQCWPCDTVQCAAQCAGTCTPTGCDCACDEATCSCPFAWEDPFCNNSDVCDCQCEESLCDAHCAGLGQQGACDLPSDTCQCSSATTTTTTTTTTSTTTTTTTTSTTTTTTTATSTSSGMCDDAMCNASCPFGLDGACNGMVCECTCAPSDCDPSCPFGTDGGCPLGPGSSCSCVCDPLECAGVSCPSGAVPQCMGPGCMCVCDPAVCDMDCAPDMGSCFGGSCVCSSTAGGGGAMGCLPPVYMTAAECQMNCSADCSPCAGGTCNGAVCTCF